MDINNEGWNYNFSKEQTWSIVPLPQGKKPFGCRWIYNIKYNSDGTIERYKPRLIAKGHNQQYVISKMVTVHTILALTVTNNWVLGSCRGFHRKGFHGGTLGIWQCKGNLVCRLLKYL